MDKVKAVLGFIKTHWYVVPIVILALMLFTEHARYTSIQGKYDKLTKNDKATIDDLKKRLNFRDNDLAVLKFENGRLTALVRNKPGSTVSNESVPFIPPEGSATGRISVTNTITGEITVDITIKDKGFTCRPGIGVLYSGKVMPEFDIKWIYWKRYSVKTGVTLEFADVGVSRHVDDFPWMSLFKNLELQLIVGWQYVSGLRIGAGLRVNL